MIRILLASVLLLFACTISYAEEQQVEADDSDRNPNQDLLDKGLSLGLKIEQLIDEFEQLNTQVQMAEGDNRTALELEQQEKTITVLDMLFDLSDNLHAQEEVGLQTTELRDTVVAYVVLSSNGADRLLDSALDKYVDGRSNLEELKGFELVEFERSDADDLGWIKTIFETKMRTIWELERLGVDSTSHRENLNKRLIPFADNLSGQIRLIDREKSALEATAEGEPLSSDLGLQQLALRTREQATLNTLSAVVVLLDENEIDSTRYRQLLLETGEVSIDLFKPSIVFGLIKRQLTELLDWIGDNTSAFIIKAAIFVSILFIFRLVANFTNYMMSRSFASRRVETSRLMQEMLLSMSSRGIMLLGLLVALGQMGFEITALLAGLGIAGFIVGFALQDSLANFAAGIMILGYRPFDVDDIVEAGGVTGTVSKMNLVSTTILTFDNQTLILPNNRIWGDVICNITLQQKRRIDMEFRVAYDEDIGRVKSIISRLIEDHEKILEDPSPTVQMNELSPYAMVFVVRPWVERADYWSVKWELLRTIKETLDSEGIKIPILNQGVVATS